MEPQKAARPFFVTAIALLYFARAALILFAVLGPLRGIRFDPTLTSPVQVVTLNAFLFFVPRSETPRRPYLDPADGEFGMAMNILFAAPIAALSAYVGFGLMLRKKSGRALAVVWSLLMVLFWLRGLMFSWAFRELDQRYFTSAQTKNNIMLTLFLNGFIFLYLVYGEGVAHAFGEKD
jgi:hypothetical protein